MKFNRKFFNPSDTFSGEERDALGIGDQRSSVKYVFSESIVLAVNVALATDRPLLVAGSPGSGKSSLAEAIAGVLGRRYYEKVVTSRTQANDLLWF